MADDHLSQQHPRLHHVRLVVNGERHELDVPTEARLVDVLRDHLELTGTKEGCGIGVCGLCSVLVDGLLVSGCLVPVVTLADGAQVETVEGLAEADGTLSPVQDAFIRHGGFQCGICTPGQVVAATALLRATPSPSEDEVREWMTGTLCRCTGYQGILDAVCAAAEAGSDAATTSAAPAAAANGGAR